MPRWGDLGLIMENISKLEVLEEAGEHHEQETFDVIDNFMENKLIPFLAVAVPIYFGAHIIVYILRHYGIFN